MYTKTAILLMCVCFNVIHSRVHHVHRQYARQEVDQEVEPESPVDEDVGSNEHRESSNSVVEDIKSNERQKSENSVDDDVKSNEHQDSVNSVDDEIESNEHQGPVNSVDEDIDKGEPEDTAEKEVSDCSELVTPEEKLEAPEDEDECIQPRPQPPSFKQHLVVGRKRRGVWAYCDMQTTGGGWTVFQRRAGPQVNFYRNWTDYEGGFGDSEHDFWLGLTYLHSMTFSKRYVLRVDLADWEGGSCYAEYNNFTVRGCKYNYRLDSLGTYRGTCGDSLKYHLNQMFTTPDRDNDKSPINCSHKYHGAWWYEGCHHSNLNGKYFVGGTHSSYGDGINWLTGKGLYYSYKKAEMKIRPFDF